MEADVDARDILEEEDAVIVYAEPINSMQYNLLLKMRVLKNLQLPN